MLQNISINLTHSSKDARMTKYAEIIAQIPPHLKQYIVDQDYSRYTPVDQATWRFILRQLKSFLTVNAHESYVGGLAKTGISVDSIPHIDVMCEKLQEFGWTAVPVSGFIPPAAFMELQSLSLLPIACDMRSVDHILYTPAPDIVHEAAGHAPILADSEFAGYLKEYAQVAKKAIISSEDLAQYEAIRDLSDIKENPASTAQEIAEAEKRLQEVNNSISHISEAALLGRMNWWTAEYGLVGDVNSPKIFGAGILSSVGEARGCLSKNVKKIPLTVDCVDVSYDITEQQPQLFVAKSFADLSKVLHQLEERLAFKKGGVEGMRIAQRAATVNTVELNSGLQISGKLAEIVTSTSGEALYYKFAGPVQLSENGAQLKGHGKDYHAEGFSSPLGLLRGSTKCLSEYAASDLKSDGIAIGSTATLNFESGVIVTGLVKSLTYSQSKKLMLIAFENATVKKGDTVFFDPAWGTFDMAVGSRVVSVFGGPADRANYGLIDSFVQKTIPRKKYSTEELLKHSLYQSLRDLREGKMAKVPTALEAIVDSLKKSFPNEWLAFVEALEISLTVPEFSSTETVIREQLNSIRSRFAEKTSYIELGLSLAGRKI